MLRLDEQDMASRIFSGKETGACSAHLTAMFRPRKLGHESKVLLGNIGSPCALSMSPLQPKGCLPSIEGGSSGRHLLAGNLKGA